MRTWPGASEGRPMRCISSSLQCPQWVQTSPSKSCMLMSLLRLDADLADDLAPLVVVVLHHLGELFRGVADGNQVQVRQPLCHVGFLHDARHFPGQRLDTI